MAVQQEDPVPGGAEGEVHRRFPLLTGELQCRGEQAAGGIRQHQPLAGQLKPVVDLVRQVGHRPALDVTRGRHVDRQPQQPRRRRVGRRGGGHDQPAVHCGPSGRWPQAHHPGPPQPAGAVLNLVERPGNRAVRPEPRPRQLGGRTNGGERRRRPGRRQRRVELEQQRQPAGRGAGAFRATAVSAGNMAEAATTARTPLAPGARVPAAGVRVAAQQRNPAARQQIRGAVAVRPHRRLA